MPDETPTCLLTRSAVADAYFIEHRAKLLDLAAFLDRYDRAQPDGKPEDFRIRALRKAMTLLSDGKPDRAKRVLDLLSDHTTEPIAKAGTKGASGACDVP